MKVLLVVLLAVFLALFFIRADAASIATQILESPLPTPPPPCYCNHMTFVACVNSDGCWDGPVDDVNYCVWRPWGTGAYPLRYTPPGRAYLPFILR